MIQKHVTSLEISKRLKELGVPQESEFYWVVEKDNFKNIYSKDDIIVEFSSENDYGDTSYPTVLDILNNDKWSDWKNDKNITICSAFLSSELGEILPSWIGVMKRQIDYLCYDFMDYRKENFENQSANTEANARGLMLIYLLENGLIKLN